MGKHCLAWARRQSWTLFERVIEGDGEYYLKTFFDDCGWAFLDGELIAHQTSIDQSLTEREYRVELSRALIRSNSCSSTLAVERDLISSWNPILVSPSLTAMETVSSMRMRCSGVRLDQSRQRR